MPNVLLEAWCQGVPALVLFHDPGGAVSTHGLGGFADGSRERMVALALELWATRFDRSQLAERCREYVARHHAPAVVVERWLSVLAGEMPGRELADGAAEVELTCAG
jgi:glycosyltransferase involved in cell wall biosynthesis